MAHTRKTIKAFKAFCNDTVKNWSNGRYTNTKRGYGDYLYAQHRDDFMWEMEVAIKDGLFKPAE